jgi:hypothetical protein
MAEKGTSPAEDSSAREIVITRVFDASREQTQKISVIRIVARIINTEMARVERISGLCLNISSCSSPASHTVSCHFCWS